LSANRHHLPGKKGLDPGHQHQHDQRATKAQGGGHRQNHIDLRLPP
jgi:hypothetical protein